MLIITLKLKKSPIRNGKSIYMSIFKVPGLLSQYSTATQIHSCWVLMLAYTPTPQFHVPYTYMLVSKNAKKNAKPPMRMLKFAFPPTLTPNASALGPQRQILALAIYISCFLCQLHLRWIANANPVSGGIWPYCMICKECKMHKI